MNCKRNGQNRWNPALRWGVILNAAVLLLRYGFPGLLPDSIMCLCQGFTTGLMLMGLVFLSPERTARIRAWKEQYLHA